MNQVLDTASIGAASGATIVRVNNSILPRLLTATQAAAYVGYKSTEVLKRIPVRPVVITDDHPSARRWDRNALDRWIDDLGGLCNATSSGAGDLEAEFAAWEARRGH